MKILKILILLIFSTNLFAQKNDDQIVECLNKNFELVGIDYFKIIEEVEIDLINNNIINETTESRLYQISQVSEIGIIENQRTYENIKLEQLGISSIKHCVNLITYTLKDCEAPDVFRLFKDLEYLNQKIQQKQNFSLFEIRKRTAYILNEYRDHFAKNSRLWNIIMLEYLYWISDLKEINVLPDLAPFGSEEIDMANAFELHVRVDDSLLVQDKVIDYEDICDIINTTIQKNQLINLTCDKGTKFAFYYKVFNDLNECIEALRDEKAKQMYDKYYDQLTTVESEIVNKSIPRKIIENKPK